MLCGDGDADANADQALTFDEAQALFRRCDVAGKGQLERGEFLASMDAAGERAASVPVAPTELDAPPASHL